MRNIFLSMLLTTCYGCSAVINNTTTYQPCSYDWFKQVEQQLTTGDNQGHGPDLGSIEWRHVVEFRLGIRGETVIPDVNSADWCNYINTHYL
jgi:hypothetical protein